MTLIFLFFFFNDTATTEIYTLSYTTLFRSLRARARDGRHDVAGEQRRQVLGRAPERRPRVRSEEHTSELQSRLHLVCRLLLEKKKKNKICSQMHPRIYRHASPPDLTPRTLR